jgi:heptosyltransferase-2
MPITAATPERILVVCNGFLGDTVLGIPFLRNLRRRFPQAIIDVLIEPHTAAVLANCPYQDEILAWPRPPRSQRLMPAALTALLGHAAWLRSRRYSRAYLFKRSFSSGLLVWLAGIPWRVGHASEGRGWLLSRAVRTQHGRHQAEASLDLLRGDGIEVDDGHAENWVSAQDRAAIDRLLMDLPTGRPRVFLALRSTNAEKHWPIDRWAAVIDWLVTVRGCEVFFCGGPADRSMHAEVVGLLDSGTARHTHDLSALVPLRQVGALLARMDLCVGIDSGLPHIAASHGVPVVVLFGPTDPRQWHPWKTASDVVVAERRTPQAGGSMRSIGVEKVTAAIAGLLRPSADGQSADGQSASWPRRPPTDLDSADHSAAATPARKALAQAH